MEMICKNCNGHGSYMATNPHYGDSDYPDEPMDVEEICPFCNGTGEIGWQK